MIYYSLGYLTTHIGGTLRKKFGVRENGIRNLFTRQGKIVAKVPQNADPEEIAIEVDAQDVSKIEEDLYEFTCDPNLVN